MNSSPLIKGMIILLALTVCLLCFLPSTAPAKAKRGEVPQCQETCLAYHRERMEELSDEYLKTGNKITYQDQVEIEVLAYSRCLTECREVLPVK
jgi:hypothetical protein